jgi:hypothetical protein
MVLIRPDTAPRDRMTVLADDERLYDSFREGEFSYRVPVPNGRGCGSILRRRRRQRYAGSRVPAAAA